MIRHFLFFLGILALTLFCGERIQIPNQRPTLPMEISDSCNYKGALENYLLAYAYTGENRDMVLRFLARAEELVAPCSQKAETLRMRIQSQKTKI